MHVMPRDMSRMRSEHIRCTRYNGNDLRREVRRGELKVGVVSSVKSNVTE